MKPCHSCGGTGRLFDRVVVVMYFTDELRADKHAMAQVFADALDDECRVIGIRPHRYTVSSSRPSWLGDDPDAVCITVHGEKVAPELF